DRCEAFGAVGGDSRASGLFETVRGEVHALRVRAELGHGAVPQYGLRDRSRDKRCVVPASELLDELELPARAEPGAGGSQHLGARSVEQRGDIHPSNSRAGWDGLWRLVWHSS